MKLKNQRRVAFYDALHEAARHCGLTVDSYSGRGMYGKECVAVEISDMADLLKLGMYIEAEGIRPNQIPGTSSDSMAGDIVVYWPDVEIEKEESDDEEEDF